MKVKYSICCPIHNEEKYLPYAISSWLRLNPRPMEFVLVFDRCSDRSMKISRKYLKNLKHKFIIKEKPNSEWKFQVAHNRQLAFNATNSNVILNTDADIILDPKITEYLNLVGTRFDMISFRRLDYPLNPLQGRGEGVFPLYFGFSPTYSVWKPLWKKVGFSKEVLFSEDITFMVNFRKKGFKYHYETSTRSLHLRKTKQMSQIDAFMRGVYKWKFHNSPVWKVFFSTLIRREPKLLLGYLYAKKAK